MDAREEKTAGDGEAGPRVQVMGLKLYRPTKETNRTRAYLSVRLAGMIDVLDCRIAEVTPKGKPAELRLNLPGRYEEKRGFDPHVKLRQDLFDEVQTAALEAYHEAVARGDEPTGGGDGFRY